MNILVLIDYIFVVVFVVSNFYRLREWRKEKIKDDFCGEVGHRPALLSDSFAFVRSLFCSRLILFYVVFLSVPPFLVVCHCVLPFLFSFLFLLFASFLAERDVNVYNRGRWGLMKKTGGSVFCVRFVSCCHFVITMKLSFVGFGW